MINWYHGFLVEYITKLTRDISLKIVACLSIIAPDYRGYPQSGFERDFMKSLSRENQADIIEAFNSTSRYLDDLLNIDNIYFD